jgi:hypothetical protein
MEVVASTETVQTSTSGNFGNLVDQVAVANLPIVDDQRRDLRHPSRTLACKCTKAN